MAQLINALVMKIKPENNTMLVVTEEGDFWEVPLAKPHPGAGALVQVQPPVLTDSLVQDTAGPIIDQSRENQHHVRNKPSTKTRSAHSWQKWFLPAAAACLMLLFLSGLNILFYGGDQGQIIQTRGNQPTNQVESQPVKVAQNGQPVEPARTGQSFQLAQVEPAYVMAVDINPSLELWLDDNLHYLGAESLNSEAAALLTKANLSQGTPLVLVMERLVAAAKDDRFLLADQDNLILATLIKTSLDEPADLTKLQEATVQIEATLMLTLAAQDIESDIALRTSTGEELAKAKANKVSINKMYLAGELASRGITLDLEKVNGEKVGKLLQETGLPPGQVIKELKHAGKNKNLINAATEQEVLDKITEKITEIKDTISYEQRQQQAGEIPKPKEISKTAKEVPAITAKPEKPEKPESPENPENPEKKELPQITKEIKPGPVKPEKQIPSIKKTELPVKVPKVLEDIRPQTPKLKNNNSK